MIIGRMKEKSILSRIRRSGHAEFLVVHGPNGAGKTALLESFFEKYYCCVFQVTGIQDGTLEENLLAFTKEVSRVFFDDAKIETPDTWMQAFAVLNKAIEHQDQLESLFIFFDNFSALATPRSELLESLEYYWDHFWKNNKRVKLIVCGASAAWSIKKILHPEGALSKKITEQFKLAVPYMKTETIVIESYLRKKVNAFFKKLRNA